MIIMKKTKILAALAALTLSVGVGTSAFAFTDMPEGEMGTALQNAVDAGLINGIDDKTIAPYDNITRAQMATIITRAFSASAKSGKIFNDVSIEAWYADSISKAVAMGAFEGDENNNFRPENYITFQETYLVLSRIFGFEPYTTSKGTLQGDCDISVLDKFADKGNIDAWAVNGAKYIVGNGGWDGIDGQLKPKDYITRGEFAILMDSIVATYIDEPGVYDNIGPGLTMVRCGDVEIKNLQTNDNLVITYGVDEKGCKITDSKINGVTLVLGGVDATPSEMKFNDGSVKIMPDESYVVLAGSYYDVRVKTPYVLVDASAAKVEFLFGVPNTLVYRLVGNE
jgi:hypothetical protein